MATPIGLPRYLRIASNYAASADKSLSHHAFLPSCWSALDRNANVQIDEDGLVARYVGPGKTESDAAAVRSNRCIPQQCGLFYFEISVVDRGRDGHLAVGICQQGASLCRLPGWEVASVGYHGDDGMCFTGLANGAPFGPTWGTGDVIGCGLDVQKRRLFYTKNGVFLGFVKNFEFSGASQWFPVIGFRTPGEVMRANFGVDESCFLFDVVAYAIRQKLSIVREVFSAGAEVDEVEKKKLVLEHLISIGAGKTAASFYRNAFIDAPYQKCPRATKAVPIPTEASVREFLRRGEKRRLLIERLVRGGNIRDTMAEVNLEYPELLKEEVDVSFELELFLFLQLLQQLRANGERNLKTQESLFQLGREMSARYSHDSQKSRRLEEAFSLVPCSDLARLEAADSSTVASVAHTLNSAILRREGSGESSLLGTLVKAAQLTVGTLGEYYGPANFLRLSEFLQETEHFLLAD